MNNYVTDAQRAQMAKVMFDLHLGFAIIYKTDEDTEISLQLIKGASWALDQILDQINNFLVSVEQVKKFFEAPMLVKLCEFMEQ